ncbi:MAG TPA: TIM barrel protein [Parafilimonas sp.]|nr:TIM barrel protein [Parafilimonas sp.]
MQRRHFMQQSALAGAGLLAASAARAGIKKTGMDNAPFHLNYGIHDGMFKNSAGDDFIDQIKYAYDLGFRAIEDNGMTGRSESMQQKIGDTLAKLGMQMGVFVIDKGGNDANSLTTGKQEYIDIFLKGCRQAVEVAKRVNATWVTLVPGDFDRHKSIDMQTANVIAALRRGVEILEPAKLVMVLEPLSDNPDLFLRDVEQAYMICRSVGSPSCKILYDMYHIQRNRGDIIRQIDDAWEEIAYFQIGDNPGRKEPTTGEMNYKNIFKHIYDKGYKGVMGMEHGISKPGKDGEAALVKAYRDSDAFV